MPRISRRVLTAVLVLVASIPPTAQAQTESVPARGITVVGRGTFTVPADMVRIAIRTVGTLPDDGAAKMRTALAGAHLRSVRIYAPQFEPFMPTFLAAPSPTPEQERAIAMQRASIAQNQTALLITVSMGAPTVEKIRALSDVVGGALGASARIASMTELYGVDDCAPIEVRMLKAAAADAKQRATVVAKLSGVRLGAVIAAASTAPGAPVCTPFPPQSNYFGDPLGVIAPPEVTFSGSMTVTYAIAR
jgi:uncharacterized protein YggE